MMMEIDPEFKGCVRFEEWSTEEPLEKAALKFMEEALPEVFKDIPPCFSLDCDEEELKVSLAFIRSIGNEFDYPEWKFSLNKLVRKTEAWVALC